MPGARWCDFSYRTHDFEPFISSCLGHPNRLTLIQLSVIGMSSVGCLGDGDLPMKDDLHIQQLERNYTAHVECLGYMYMTLMRSRCHTGPSSKRMAVIPGIKSN